MLYHFQQLFEQQQKQLLSDERQLQYQLRTLSDGTEHKTNKSVKADNSKEKEKDLDEKLQRVRLHNDDAGLVSTVPALAVDSTLQVLLL